MDEKVIFASTEIPTLENAEAEKEIENVQIEKEGGR